MIDPNAIYDPQSLEAKTPSELAQRRSELVAYLQTLPKKYEDAPEAILQELAFVTGALRRKTAGPPKTAKPSKRTPAIAATADDLADLL